MASFPTHISFGIALGILSVLALISIAVGGEPSFLITVFAAAALGSILPDMDSDSGIPFHITFGSLTTVAAVLIFYSIHQTAPSDWVRAVLWAALAAVFIWGIVGYVFKRFTRHRGMAHSLPAALLAGLAMFFVAARFHFSDTQSFLLGVAIMAGYILHLVLDEIWAGLNLNGSGFVPNKAFGSALKFRSHNHMVNLLVFGAIIFLAAGNTQRLWGLAQTFWEKIN